MNDRFKQFYTLSNFKEKVTDLSQTSNNQSLIQTAVTLFVILSDETVPFIVKSCIIGALSYLIAPIDMIPDVIFPIGLTDDAVVLATTLVQVQTYNNKSVQQRVGEIMEDLKIF